MIRRLHHPAPQLRRGLSLLEVVLALVILASSMVAIGQLMMLGAQYSTTVQEQSRGLQYAQSLLDSVAVGVVPMQPEGFTPLDSDPEWQYSLTVEESPVNGLQVVVATVQLIDQQPFAVAANQSATAGSATKPSTVQLTRWIVDPTFVTDRILQQVAIDDVAIDALIDAEAAAEDAGGGADAGGGGGR